MIKRSSISLAVLAALSGSLLVSGCTAPEVQPSAAGDTESVRYLNNIGQMAVGLVGQSEGFFEDAGVEVEFAQIDSGTEAIAAMVGGSADFVTAADARLLQSVDADLPIVAIGIHNTGYLASIIVPVGDTTTESMEDLVGKRIGVQVGTGVYNVWLRSLAAQGLAESDFEVVNLTTSDIPAALAGGSLDAGMVWQPFTSVPVENGVARVALTAADIAEPADVVYPFYLLTTQEMVDTRPEAVQRFIDGWVCSQLWVAEHPDETTALLVPEFPGLSEQTVLNQLLEQHYDEHLTIDNEVLADTIAQAEVLVTTGRIAAVPSGLEDHIDNSFVESAIAKGCGA